MNKLAMNAVLGAATLAGAMASTGAAHAADEDWGTLSATATVTSDYRYRGVSQNVNRFSPQASIDWAAPNGFYAGVWTSTTDWIGVAGTRTPSYEVDIYGGKHFDLGGSDLNVEAYYYAYPDADTSILGPKRASYVEGIFQLSHGFGDLALTATGAVSPQYSLGGGTAGYIGGTASYPVTGWLSLSGNVGHQWVQAAPTDYTHFDLGLTATWRRFVLDVRANGTDLDTVGCNFYMTSSVFNSGICTTGVVGTLTYNIPDLLDP